MKRHVPYLLLFIAAAMAVPVIDAEVRPADGAVADAQIAADTNAATLDNGPDKGGKGTIGKSNDNGKKKGQLRVTTTSAAEETSTTVTAGEESQTTTTAADDTTTTTLLTTTTTTTALATTTTAPPTTEAPTTTTAPITSSTATTSPPSEGPVEWVSPEGVTIVIDSAGDWTVERIYQMLLQNALDLDLIGPTLTIKVQDKDLSSTTAGVASGPGGYYDFSATMHLKGVDSSFADKPDAILAHEYGHAWSLYHLYLTQQGHWSAWLEFRGIAGDPRLDTTYPWTKMEMIAEDYRLLFSTPTALAQWPGQMNSDISDAREVPGLADFLQNVWGG